MQSLESLWLRILGRCTLFSAPAVVVVAVIFTFINGWSGLVSGLFGGLLVIAFFAISLLIGHLFGGKAPTASLGIFAITYVVKFVGFAAVLILLGTPQWLSKIPFFIGALVAVLVWQTVELLVFSKAKLLAFPAAESDRDSSEVGSVGR